MIIGMYLRRFWVSGIVLAATIALLPFSFHAERRLETATRVEGSPAETVREELASRFRSPFVDRVVLVIEGLPPADSEQGGQALETIVAALREQPGVARSDFSGPGRRNVCSRRTHFDRRSSRVACSGASPASKLA